MTTCKRCNEGYYFLLLVCGRGVLTPIGCSYEWGSFGHMYGLIFTWETHSNSHSFHEFEFFKFHIHFHSLIFSLGWTLPFLFVRRVYNQSLFHSLWVHLFMDFDDLMLIFMGFLQGTNWYHLFVGVGWGWGASQHISFPPSSPLFSHYSIFPFMDFFPIFGLSKIANVQKTRGDCTKFFPELNEPA